MLHRHAVTSLVWLLNLLKRLGWFYGIGLLVAATAILAFAKLTDDLLDGEVQDVNVGVLQSLHSHSGRELDGVALALTWLGGAMEQRAWAV